MEAAQAMGLLGPAIPVGGSPTLSDQLATYVALAAPAGLVWASLLVELTLAVGCIGVTAKIVRDRATSRAESCASW